MLGVAATVCLLIVLAVGLWLLGRSHEGNSVPSVAISTPDQDRAASVRLGIEEPALERALALSPGSAPAALLPATRTVTSDDFDWDLPYEQGHSPPGWDGTSRVSVGPRDLCVNAAGEIYLLGRDGATIFRFGRSSEPLGSFPVAGASGNGPSELSRLLVDGVGRIHGQTPDDGMVVAYDASGRLLAMTPRQAGSAA